MASQGEAGQARLRAPRLSKERLGAERQDKAGNVVWGTDERGMEELDVAGVARL
jgi:hypothetical protein